MLGGAGGDAHEDIQTLWVDAQYDYSVRRFLTTRGNVVRCKLDVDYQRDPDVGWVPKSWTIIRSYVDGSLLMSASSSVGEYRINPTLDAAEFQIEFPPGTYVVDTAANQRFIQKDDGRRATHLAR